MAKALRAGGLYKRGEIYVDAEGNEVPKAEVRKALKSADPEEAPKGKKTKTPEAPESDLPEDFPGRAELIKAGITEKAKVDELDRDGLIEVKGIGEKTADEILALRSGD